MAVSCFWHHSLINHRVTLLSTLLSTLHIHEYTDRCDWLGSLWLTGKGGYDPRTYTAQQLHNPTLYTRNFPCVNTDTTFRLTLETLNQNVFYYFTLNSLSLFVCLAQIPWLSPTTWLVFMSSSASASSSLQYHDHLPTEVSIFHTYVLLMECRREIHQILQSCFQSLCSALNGL